MTVRPPAGGKPRRVLHLVHHHPGRLRVRSIVFEGRTDVADDVRATLLGVPGVTDVQHNAKSGSVLVVYEPGPTDVDAVLDAILEGADLDDLVDEVNGALPAADLRRELFEGARTVDDVVLELTGGRADIRTVVAGALAAGSLYAFATNPKKGRFPRWDNLLWWSYAVLTGDAPRAAVEQAE